MTEIREQLLEMLKAVATALGDDLRNRLVFVGGCTTALFITDPVTLEDVRSTDDIDLIVDLAGLHEWAMLLEDLRTKGFVEAADDDVICRMRLGRLKVDFMPDDEAILGFSNRWYATGIETAQPHILDAGLDIKVLTPPIFVATKLEAFRGRGNNDLYASRDAEDLLLMVDGREELLALLANSDFDDFLEGNLRKQPGRSAIVKARYVAISQCDGQNAG
jgi:predicted nucleotidyltransferase